jgi:hypothetical protein
VYTLYSLCGRDKEKCYLYNNRKYRVYRLYSGVHLQYYDKRCDLYNLFWCLCRGNHLSIHSMYRNDK